MTFQLTSDAQNALDRVNIEPMLALEIDGVSTIYTAAVLEKYIKIGDPGLVIGGGWVVGGKSPVDDQADYVTLDGTTTSITQQLNQDKGIGSSVSSMQISLQDRHGEITELITPGEVVEDVLGRRAKVYLGFRNTAYPDDFVTIFRGIIDEITAYPNKVTFNIAHPDQKKRQDLFQKIETNLNGALNDSNTTVTVNDTGNYLQRQLGPDGTYDTSILYYIRIDDEVIQYTGLTGTTFTGCTRGSLNTTAAAHDDDATVDPFYRLQGNSMTLALKLMLSGMNGPYLEDISAKNFNIISSSEYEENAIFFSGVDLISKYNIQNGDYITTLGASNGANNVTLKEITSIVVLDSGTYIIVDGVTFVDETDTAATVSFRSQYDTLGEGLAMYPDEVDIDEHIRIYRLFLSSFNYDFYIKDTVNLKEFIENEIYSPAAAYSLPRNSQSSVGYHIGPIPSANIIKLSEDNIIKPSTLQLKRSINKNFYNTVVYSFEQDVLSDDFLFGVVEHDADSISRIDVGVKSLTIESTGMRKVLQGPARAVTASTRRLNRYKFGAEYFDQVQLLFKDGFKIEIGDIVLFDALNLQIANTTTADRTSENLRFYEVVNKSIDLKTGAIKLALVDTNYSTSNRYGLISPSSKIKAGLSQTQFIIKSSFSSVFGDDEFRKWSRFAAPGVKVRNDDFSRNASSTIRSISGNTITLDSALGFTPQADDIMEFANYNDCTSEQKLIYAFQSDASFSDGKSQYVQL